MKAAIAIKRPMLEFVGGVEYPNGELQRIIMHESEVRISGMDLLANLLSPLGGV